jgi:hypothetical protein
MRAAASIRCSQLSSSTSTCLPLSAVATLSTERVPLTGGRPSAVPTVIGMSWGVGEWCQLGQPDAVGEPRRQLTRDFQTQARLAYAARTGQRHQPVGRGQLDHRAHGCIAADQLGHGLGQVRPGRGRRPRSGGADLTGELIATPGHRSDQIAVIAECLPERGNLSLEVVFLDGPVRPDPAHQDVFVDDRAAGVDEHEQRVEGPPAQRDGFAVGDELSAMRHDLEATEFQDRERIPLAVHRRALYGLLQEFRIIQNSPGVIATVS